MDTNTSDQACCTFCGKSLEDSDLLIANPEGNTFICSKCVRLCEALVVERDIQDVYLFRIPGERIREHEKKIRPITRMPKRWVVYDVNLYAATPYVIACDSEGKKYEDFSIPKQLAHWILTKKCNDDVQELKKEIKEEIIETVRASLKFY